MAGPYRYHVMNPGNTPVLAWTDTGQPLVAWRPLGKGLLIVGATEHWLDETHHLLPVAEALLRLLAEAFTPIQMPENFEVLLNSTADGWLVGIINNNPAAGGQPETPQAGECIISFKKGAPLRFTPHLGQFKWSNPANGLLTTLQPGEAAVVSVTLEEKPRN